MSMMGSERKNEEETGACTERRGWSEERARDERETQYTRLGEDVQRQTEGKHQHHVDGPSPKHDATAWFTDEMRGN